MATELKIEKSLNVNSSYTPGPILFKLHRNVALMTLYQNSKNGFALMNKMAASAKKKKIVNNFL